MNTVTVMVGGQPHAGVRVRADEVVVGDVVARSTDNIVRQVVLPHPEDRRHGGHQRVWIQFDHGGFPYYPHDLIALIARPDGPLIIPSCQSPGRP